MGYKEVVGLGACVVALVAGAGCGGGARHENAVVIGRKSATGSKAAATAVGKVGSFGTLSVRVNASPDQRVSGSWAVTCRQGTSWWRDADDFGGRTPLTVVTRAGATSNHDCTLVGDARLTGSGRVRLELLASELG